MFTPFFRERGGATNAYYKVANDFYHPMGTNVGNPYSPLTTYNNALKLEMQVHLGSKLYPEYPMKSIAETFTQLRKSVGVAASPIHSFHFDADKYRSVTSSPP